MLLKNIIGPADFYRINFDNNCSSKSNQASIAKQGYALSIAIQDVLNVTGRNKGILIGHSMGGLVLENIYKMNLFG